MMSSIDGAGESEDVGGEEVQKKMERERKLQVVPLGPNKPNKHVDKLFACDRLSKFRENGRITFGDVAINRMLNITRIYWMTGECETLESGGGGAGVILNDKVGILDRKSVGLGSKVRGKDGKLGHVREKRFLVSLVLKSDESLVIKDVNVEDLIKLGVSEYIAFHFQFPINEFQNARKDDKVVYKDWIGLLVNTRARIFFKMDKDGKTGDVGDDSYLEFPVAGDTIPHMNIHCLWDATWHVKDNWVWNFFKYLGNSATIYDSKVECYSIAWMGNVNDGISSCPSTTPPPPNPVRGPQEVEQVKRLQGRNWKYVREFDTWGHKWRKDETLITYHQWARELSDELFFGPEAPWEWIDMDEIDGEGGERVPQYKEGDIVPVKVASWNSVLHVEWDDGTFETLYSYEVEPYFYPLPPAPTDIPMNYFRDYAAGDIVQDVNEPDGKYAYVHRVFSDKVQLKWIYPSDGVGAPRVTDWVQVPLSQIVIHEKYQYLKFLHHLPLLVPAKKDGDGVRRGVDGVRFGIAVAIDAPALKIVLKCGDQREHLVWAHDFEHFEGDVFHDSYQNKWVPWYQYDAFKRITHINCNFKNTIKLQEGGKSEIFSTLLVDKTGKKEDCLDHYNGNN